MFTKIQPQQITLHTFSSPSGDMRFTVGESTVEVNLSRFLTGDFDFTGAVRVNGSLINNGSVDNTVEGNNAVLVGSDNTLEYSGNAIVRSNDSTILGNKNVIVNGDDMYFNVGAEKNTSIGASSSTFDSNVSGSVVLSDGISIINVAASNRLFIDFVNGAHFNATPIFIENAASFNNGAVLNLDSASSIKNSGVTDFYGTVRFHGSTSGLSPDVINGTVLLTGDQNILGNKVFSSGITVSGQNFIFSAGGGTNGSINYPTSNTDVVGSKGEFEYVNNQLFLKNGNHWIRFIGSTGLWQGYTLNSGGLKVADLSVGGVETTLDLLEWEQGNFKNTNTGVKTVTSFPRFGGSGQMLVPDSGGNISLLEWKNGLITTVGVISGALSGDVTGFGNNASGLLTVNGSEALSWFNGLVGTTGTNSLFLVPNNATKTISGETSFTGGATYFSSRPQVSGKSVMLENDSWIFNTGVFQSGLTTSGILYAKGTGSITRMIFSSGSSSSIAITSSIPSANRIYNIPDVSGNADFVMTKGNQTIEGNKTFSGQMFFTSVPSGAGDLANYKLAAFDSAFGDVLPETLFFSLPDGSITSRTFLVLN